MRLHVLDLRLQYLGTLLDGSGNGVALGRAAREIRERNAEAAGGVVDQAKVVADHAGASSASR